MHLALFSITSENIATTTAYISEVFSDLKLLIFFIVGISLALWIISSLISNFKTKNENQ